MDRLRVAVLFIMAMVITGVIGYHVLEGYTWLEALYMTVITLSTVGFQEVRPLSATGRIFTIALLVGGVGVVFYTAVAVAEKVVAGEFQQFFGRIGEVISRELASKPVPFVVIEQELGRVRKAEEADYFVLQGDAADEKVLVACGVAKGKGLFAALPTDADNVFVTLTAKELNSSLFVVARAESEQTAARLKRAGADAVISPYSMGGPRMARAVLRRAVVEIIELATHHQSVELQLEEVGIAPRSPCDGVTLRQAGLCEPLDVIVVAIKRPSGRMIFNPAPDESIGAGDRLVVLGDPPRLRELERRVG